MGLSHVSAGHGGTEAPNRAERRFYFLIQEKVCHGHGRKNVSVRQWIDDRQIEPFDTMQTSFRQFMMHPGWQEADKITPQQLSMFYIALYDVDRFRRFVFDTRFLDLFDIDESRIEAIRTDDEELVEFAFDWLAFSLFHEKRMRIKRPPAGSEPAPAPAGLKPTAVSR